MNIIRTFLCFSIISFLNLGISYGQDWDHAPKPEDYPVKEIYKGKVAPPILDSPKAKMFGTVLRTGAKAGPNFAGHYTMVVWGCGLGSFELAIVDAITGKIYFPPFGCISLAGGIDLPIYGGKDINPGFNIDSKVFFVIGLEDKPDANPKDRAAQFYVFDEGKFRMIYSLPVPWNKEEISEENAGLHIESLYAVPSIITAFTMYNVFYEQFSKQMNVPNPSQYMAIFKRLDTNLRMMGHDMPDILGFTKYCFTFQADTAGSIAGFYLGDKEKFDSTKVPLESMLFVSGPVTELGNKVIVLFSGSAPQSAIVFTVDQNLNSKILYHSFSLNAINDNKTRIGEIYALKVVAPI